MGVFEQFPTESLFPVSAYVGVLRRELPKDVFKPAHSRILFVPAHLAVIVTATLAIALGWVPWPSSRSCRSRSARASRV